MFKTAISKAANQEKVSSEKRDGKKQRENNRGFTLIELMIAIAIVAILSSVAFPSYFEYIKKARMSDAKSALMGLGNALERYKAKNSDYSVGLGTIYSLHSPVEVQDCSSGSCYYGLDFAVGIESDSDTGSWIAVAVPVDSSVKPAILCLKSTGARCINTSESISYTDADAIKDSVTNSKIREYCESGVNKPCNDGW